MHVRTKRVLLLALALITVTHGSATAKADEVPAEIEAAYAEVSNGERDGFIFAVGPQADQQTVVYCVDGIVAFVSTSNASGSTLPVRPDYRPISCELEELYEVLPRGSTVVVSDHLSERWSVISKPEDGSEVAGRCQGGILVTLRMSENDTPFMGFEIGAPKCLIPTPA